jgi:hypothetical protein
MLATKKSGMPGTLVEEDAIKFGGLRRWRRSKLVSTLVTRS